MTGSRSRTVKLGALGSVLWVGNTRYGQRVKVKFDGVDKVKWVMEGQLEVDTALVSNTDPGAANGTGGGTGGSGKQSNNDPANGGGGQGQGQGQGGQGQGQQGTWEYEGEHKEGDEVVLREGNDQGVPAGTKATITHVDSSHNAKSKQTGSMCSYKVKAEGSTDEGGHWENNRELAKPGGKNDPRSQQQSQDPPKTQAEGPNGEKIDLPEGFKVSEEQGFENMKMGDTVMVTDNSKVATNTKSGDLIKKEPAYQNGEVGKINNTDNDDPGADIHTLMTKKIESPDLDEEGLWTDSRGFTKIEEMTEEEKAAVANQGSLQPITTTGPRACSKHDEYKDTCFHCLEVSKRLYAPTLEPALA